MQGWQIHTGQGKWPTWYEQFYLSYYLKFCLSIVQVLLLYSKRLNVVLLNRG